MSRNPYSSYHGRRSLGQRILIAIVIVLVIVLILALAALFILPNTGLVTYTETGVELTWPQGWPNPFHAAAKPSAAPAEETPTPSSGEDEPGFIIDAPASPSPSAPAADTDLSGYVRRTPTRGLETVSLEELLAGPGKGVILDMTGVDPAAEGLSQALADAPYAAAYLNTDQVWFGPEGNASMDFDAWAAQVAALGFDELILADVVPEDDGAALAKLYRDTKAALDAGGWKGRLSLVLDQSLAGSSYNEDLMPAIAQSFERLYFRRSLQNATKTALEDGGFDCGVYENIVTVYNTVPNVNFHWAVLPVPQ